MVKQVTLRQVGGSVSATIPKELAVRLNLEPGDKLLVVETDQGILLSPYDPNVEAGMAIARKVARKYRNALRELAK
jgi:putative addiction module antidote